MKPTNLIFFVIEEMGMVMIGIFAFTLDSGKAKSNRIEQITNAIVRLYQNLKVVLSKYSLQKSFIFYLINIILHFEKYYNNKRL